MNALQKYAVKWWGAPADVSVADAILLLQEKFSDGTISKTQAERLVGECMANDPAFAAAVEKHFADDDADDGTVLTADQIDDEVQRRVAAAANNPRFSKYFPGGSMNQDSDDVTPDMIFTPAARHASGKTAGSAGRVDLKAASARYSDVRYSAKHVRTGQPVYHPDGKQVETISERSMAIAGAFYKYRALKSGLNVKFDEHDKALLHEAIEKELWVGKLGPREEDYTGPIKIKASLLDDSISGGSYLVPFILDTDIVTFPLLNGELYPQVDRRVLAKGNIVHAASMKTPSATWNTTEGSASIPLYDNSSTIAQINTTIHNLDVAVQIGLDEMSDAAVDVGSYITQLIGERFQQQYDFAIARGDGVNMPSGIFSAPGVNVVPSINASSGPWTAKDTENMVAGVAKQYRNNRNKPSIGWISSDGLYWRIRGIQVSGTDQRRIYGYDYEAYQMASRPWRIQNDIGPAEVAFGDLARYRWWQRQGMEILFSREGLSLMTTHSALLVARARVGGQLMDGAAFAVCNDAQHS